MLDKIYKYIKICFFIIFICETIYVGHELIKSSHQQDIQYNEIVKRLQNGIVEKQVTVDTSKFENEIDNLDKNLKQLINQQNQKIIEIGDTTVVLNENIKRFIKSNRPIYKPTITNNPILNKKRNDNVNDVVTIMNKDSDGKEFPVATAVYYPNKPENQRWITKANKLEIHEKTVITRNYDSTKIDNVFVKTWLELPDLHSQMNKKYNINIKDNGITWITSPQPKDKFSYNPRLALSIFSGINSITPGINMSIFSYGKTDVDMTWRLLEFGISGNRKEFDLSFIPFEFNLGKLSNTTLIKNLFIGPMIGTNQYGQQNYGMTLSVPF